MTTRQSGAYAETIADAYLQARGLVLLQKNYHCRAGEIDIVMLDGDELVFVEVRYRKNAVFGGALASISHTKCMRIQRTAEDYLQHHPTLEFDGCRFDVVAIAGHMTDRVTNPAPPHHRTHAGHAHDHTIDWVKNAF